MGGRGRKESGEQGETKKYRGRIRGVFVVVVKRSHGCGKGKHFVGDGNTEEYCWPWRGAMQMRVSRGKKGIGRGG